MSDLPSGWEWTTIGEVADVQLGRQRSPKNHHGPHMRPYLRAANVTWNGIDLSDVKQMNFEPAEADVFELKPGDLLLNEASGSPNEVGKPAIWRGEIAGCCFQNTLLRVRPRRVSTEYLYWYCRAVALSGRFGEAGRGVSIRHLGKQGLAAFPLALAPLAEQERIVAAVEEHVSRLDAALASARAAKRKVDVLRLALMRSAFVDGLGVLERPAPTRLLGEVLDLLLDHRGKTAKKLGGDFVQSGVPVISAIHIKGGRICWDERHRFVTRDMFERWMPERTRAGDVLLTSEAPLGSVASVEDDDPLVLSQRLFCLRGAVGVLDNQYLRYFLESPVGQRRLLQRSSGTTVTGIRQSELRRVVIPVPSLADQRRIVALLDTSLSRLAGTAPSVALERRCSAVRSAVLHAAFAGRLAPQDPDDEPAAVLLDRTRAERIATTPAKRNRKARAW